MQLDPGVSYAMFEFVLAGDQPHDERQIILPNSAPVVVPDVHALFIQSISSNGEGGEFILQFKTLANLREIRCDVAISNLAEVLAAAPLTEESHLIMPLSDWFVAPSSAGKICLEFVRDGGCYDLRELSKLNADCRARVGLLWLPDGYPNASYVKADIIICDSTKLTDMECDIFIGKYTPWIGKYNKYYSTVEEFEAQENTTLTKCAKGAN